VYHHLYEYGTAAIFCSVGRPYLLPDSPHSGPDRRRATNLKFTYDERAEDGLAAWFTLRRMRQVIEDPQGSGLVVEARAASAVTAPDSPPVEHVAATVDSSS
jgi:hypothetical protein